MAKYVGFKIGKVHESHVISEYYCGGCGYPVTDHDSFCPECGGAFRKHDADDLESENAKLREQGARLFDKTLELGTENAKLRELIKDMWRDIPKNDACAWDSSANTCIGSDSCIGECSYWYRMVKLGIEVES